MPDVEPAPDDSSDGVVDDGVDDAVDGASDEVRNRAYWDRESTTYQADHAEDLGARALAWGVWRIPESSLGALGPVAGRDVLELGCGAAHFSVALRAQGARVVGLDQSVAQLAHARSVVAAAGEAVPLVLASATATPFPASSFDIVFCDHGAMSFCDPRDTLPEVRRLLRPGGRLAFCVMNVLKLWCSNEEWQLTDRLQRPYERLNRLDDGQAIDFAPTHSHWIAELRTAGFAVEALHELVAPPAATTTYHWFATHEWAGRWPAEDVWVARRL